jgi:hypothetical protein
MKAQHPTQVFTSILSLLQFPLLLFILCPPLVLLIFLLYLTKDRATWAHSETQNSSDHVFCGLPTFYNIEFFSEVAYLPSFQMISPLQSIFLKMLYNIDFFELVPNFFIM